MPATERHNPGVFDDPWRPRCYVTVGVEELDQEKLTPLLKLKYHDSIFEAVADLGEPAEIGQVFAGFQRYLYQEGAAA